VRLVVDPNDKMTYQQLNYDSFGNVLHDTNPGFQPFGFAGGLVRPASGQRIGSSTTPDVREGGLR